METQLERVLVVPTELFRRLGYFQGFSGDVSRYLDELLRPENTSYRPRAEVEKDPGFKQLIPYVIFRHVDAAGKQTVFQYTRGTGQGEGRLHSKRSVGIGGHISAVDSGSMATAIPTRKACGASWRKRLRLIRRYDPQCVGMINDDQTDVGRVHLGVVHLFDVERPAVRPRETEIIECGFRPVADILADMAGSRPGRRFACPRRRKLQSRSLGG